VELSRGKLDQSAAQLDALDKVRLHLGRALASGPSLLLLEHPTAELGDVAARSAFGRTLAAVSARRALGWIAISEDAEFAKASGGASHRLKPASGEVTREHRWWSWR
jgi:ABC-type sulfate/molybdate transport systems ATPase subunit